MEDVLEFSSGIKIATRSFKRALDLSERHGLRHLSLAGYLRSEGMSGDLAVKHAIAVEEWRRL